MKCKNRTRRWLRQMFSGMVAGCLTASMMLTSIPGITAEAKEVSGQEGIEVQEEETRTFVHPGMIHTTESFAAMKENVEKEVQPNLDTWQQLKNNGFSDPEWNPRVTETVIRGVTGDNCAGFRIDIRRAYQTALVWKISGDEKYAEAACRILNGWSSGMKELGGNADRFLAAGIYGYELANVAEIMRDHPSFHKEDMEELLLDVFYPMNEDFLTNHNGAHIGNYWANWDLCNIAAMLSIGIFTDREDIYNRALTYYKTGLGNGSLYNAMPYVFEDGTVQWQESGRDQGHTTLGVSLCEVICEMAWNQGDDLYSLSDNRFLKATEYIAKYNNGEEVAYEPYQWLSGQNGASNWQNAVSEANRGLIRPVYSMVYNHYVNRMGLSAPNIKKILEPEEGTYRIDTESEKVDELGWQTLTFANTGKRTEAKEIQGDFADGKYRIRSVLTGKSIVVNDEGNLASADAGTRKDEWWTLQNTGDGEYVVTNTVTGQAMQINGDYYDYGSVIGTGSPEDSLNRRFAFVKNDTGDYRIIPTANFFVLDLQSAGTADDTPIIQYRNHSSNGQKWIVESWDEVKGLTELREAIAQAVPADRKSEYTEESWSLYEEALNEAKTVYNKEEPSQEEADAAVKKLAEAQGALKEKEKEEEPQPTPPEPSQPEPSQPSQPEPSQPEPSQPELPFVDVSENDWYYSTVCYNYFEGWMQGLDNTHFGPADPLARAQFAMILWRMSGGEKTAYQPLFPDVQENVWYTDAILWAAGTRVVTGYTDTGMFGPADKISREQMAVMMYRYAKYLGYDVSKREDFSRFEDAASVSGYAEEAMQWAVANGIITGKNNGRSLDPLGNAARAECAAIIERFIAFEETMTD